MSSNLAVRIYPEPLRTLAFGSISGTYAGIGTALVNPGRIYWLQNNTDVQLTFSWDGIIDHFDLPSGGYVLLDIASNRTDTSGSLNAASGQRTYVKGSPSSGSVSLASFFGFTGN